MNGKKLRLGKMTSKELAEWFGVSYGYFKKKDASVKKYEELKLFCDYEKKYGFVNIKEIYISEYIKNYDEQIAKNYLKEVCKNNKVIDGKIKSLGSISGITRVQEGWDDSQKDGVNRPAANRNRKVRKALFGELEAIGNFGTKGCIGSRKRTWAIFIDYDNQYEYLTAKEQKIFNKLVEEYCKTDEAKEVGNLIIDYQSGEISKEILIHALDTTHTNYYGSVIKEFKEQTGKQLVRIDEYLIKENKTYKEMLK